MPRTADLTGQRFGRLTAIAFHDKVERSKTWFRRWRCVCDCGNEVLSVVGALRNGNTQSCGCRKLDLTRERATTHGLTGTPEYQVWQGMLRRCETPTNSAFQDYGARGIKVCERWHSFVDFLADMGNRPSPEMTIERKDNSGNYEPNNCVWAPHVDQCRNQRQRKDNTSGVTGVVWNSARGKWEAFVGVGGGRRYLGLFADIPAATAARNEATASLGFNPQHGTAR